MMDEHSPDDVERLLQGAGARRTVPAERSARVKAAVHDAWTDAGRLRSRQRVIVAVASVLGAAAVVTIAIRTRTSEIHSSPPHAPIARVAAATGMVSVNGAAIRAGDAIADGASVRVGDGALASIALDGSGELRLDSGTIVTIAARGEVMLRSGAVYVDTGGDRGRAPIVVRTAFGEVRDIGTRFEIRLLGRGWRARVRDGAIRIGAAGTTRDLAAGREIVIGADGTANEQAVSPFDAGWSWATRAARPLRIEGARLDAFLRWAADESGRGVRFADADTARALASTTLHGSVDGLTAEEALDVVLPTCGLTRSLAGEQIVIARPRTRE